MSSPAKYSWRRKSLRRSLIAITGLLFFGAASSGYLVQRQLCAIRQITAFNYGADASQAAIEVLELDTALAGLEAHLPGSTDATAQRWIEILRGRVNELDTDGFRSITSEDPYQEQNIQAFVDTVKTIYDRIDDLGKPGVTTAFLHALHPYADQVPGYASFVMNAVDARVQASLSRLSLFFLYSFVLSVALVVVLGLLLWMIRQDHQETRQMLAANEALSADNRSKTLMIAGVSHEVRTPLMALLGVTELLAHSELSPSQRELVVTADAAGRSLLSLVNGMLDFAKIEAGGITLNPEPFNVAKFITEILTFARLGPKGAQIKINLHIDSRVPTMVVGDSGRLSTILTNLVTNAVKFTDPGGSVSVALHLDALSGTETRLRFVVKDTGIGIAPEKQARIFDVFTQADSTILDRYGGAGLGLATCKALVTLFDGNIGVDSDRGVGSTFWCSIPFKLPVAEIPAANMPFDLRVLLLEDTVFDLGTVERRFRAAGATVLRVAPDADAGVEPGRWDAILCFEPKLGTAMDMSRRLSVRFHPIPIVVLREDIAKPLDGEDHCFTTLDLHADEIAVERALQLISSQTAPSPVPAPAPPAQNIGGSLTVLVADDTATNLQIVRRFLERGGHTVISATNGQEALDVLRAGSVDIAIMDINMPVLNGLDAAREYRRTTPRALRVPILALTADQSEDLEQRCIEAGMSARLVKPVRSANLLQVVSLWTKEQPVTA